VGRQLFQHERFTEALAMLDEARIARGGDARVLAETRRMIAVSRYHLGDLRAAKQMFETLANDPERPQGLRETARDWVDRIDRETRSAPLR
jgi:hypothetical protein